MSGPTIAVVTCRDGDHRRAAAEAADAPLIAALRARGAGVEHVGWAAPVDWSRADLAVVRSAWDYAEDRDTFVTWAAGVGQVTALWNPADVLRWNTHKGYLLELEERGAPVVATAWLAQGDRVDLGELRAARGWDRVVCKPAVGNGGEGLHVSAVDPALDARVDQAALDTLLAAGDVLVQPLLARVATDGETSVVVLDGEVSHLVRKLPAEGDVRAHAHRGGRYERVEPVGDDAEAAALASWVVEACGVEVAYARVDLLRADDGTWQVGEVELTEPDLLLDHAPGAADRLAEVLLARAGG